jgi:hypothetical protein
MQPNETKPTPPAELSLKFMAWDIKQLAKSMTEVVIAIRELTAAINGKPKSPEVPF